MYNSHSYEMIKLLLLLMTIITIITVSNDVVYTVNTVITMFHVSYYDLLYFTSDATAAAQSMSGGATHTSRRHYS